MPDAFKENNWETTPILCWHGAITDIPAGWALCDGNNGTPDLLDRFVKGEVSPTGGGTRDGQHAVSLSVAHLPEHSHTGATGEGGGHKHELETQNYEIALYGKYDIADLDGDGVTKFTTTDGDHSHSGTTSQTGGGSAIDNRPTYYELAFIMKV